MKIIFLLGFVGITILGLYLLISASIHLNSLSRISDKLRRSVKVGAGTVLFSVGLFLTYGGLKQNNFDVVSTRNIAIELLGCFLPFGLIAAIGMFIRISWEGLVNQKVSRPKKHE